MTRQLQLCLVCSALTTQWRSVYDNGLFTALRTRVADEPTHNESSDTCNQLVFDT